MQVKVIFTPQQTEVLAEVGEPILNVADRAGIHIPTGCLAGSCHACAVEIDNDTFCACISGIPGGRSPVIIGLYEDDLW
jgi:ferredoxin